MAATPVACEKLAHPEDTANPPRTRARRTFAPPFTRPRTRARAHARVTIYY